MRTCVWSWCTIVRRRKAWPPAVKCSPASESSVQASILSGQPGWTQLVLYLILNTYLWIKNIIRISLRHEDAEGIFADYGQNLAAQFSQGTLLAFHVSGLFQEVPGRFIPWLCGIFQDLAMISSIWTSWSVQECGPWFTWLRILSMCRDFSKLFVSKEDLSRWLSTIISQLNICYVTIKYY